MALFMLMISRITFHFSRFTQKEPRAKSQEIVGFLMSLEPGALKFSIFDCPGDSPGDDFLFVVGSR
jgi:hypothetical protein